MSLPLLRRYRKNQKSKSLIIRVTEHEFALLKEAADKYTDGNYSEYIRHAVARWNPKTVKLTEEEKEYARITEKTA